MNNRKFFYFFAMVLRFIQLFLLLYNSLYPPKVNSFLKPPMKGVVIETFGAGNVPSNRPDLMNEFKIASERGVIMVNITQCLKGSVSDAYAAGKVITLYDSTVGKLMISSNTLYLGFCFFNNMNQIYVIYT